MTKIKRTVTLSAELDNVISMLASTSNQNASEFIEYRLREDEQIKRILLKIRNAKDPPHYEMEKKIVT